MLDSAVPFDKVESEEPCERHGDLLLAMESQRVEDFYTMNYAESQAYCDFLNQDLAVRPNNPANDDEEYNRAAKPWPLPRGS